MAEPKVKVEKTAEEKFEKAVRKVIAKGRDLTNAGRDWLKEEITDRRLLLKLQLGHEELTDALKEVDSLKKALDGK